MTSSSREASFVIPVLGEMIESDPETMAHLRDIATRKFKELAGDGLVTLSDEPTELTPGEFAEMFPDLNRDGLVAYKWTADITAP